ncbi:hypothetical protein JB92DRAFT_3116437 [Gautieria morchelliformis]|nr:hypothetical protein JB92DRAFT_3116437 [Gautieria morchelliformis]
MPSSPTTSTSSSQPAPPPRAHILFSQARRPPRHGPPHPPQHAARYPPRAQQSLPRRRASVPHAALASRVSLPPPVLDTLTALWETIRHVSIIGRRGPREAKFGAKELREFRGLGVGLGIKEVLKEAEAGGEELTRKQRRVLGLLREGVLGKDEVGVVRKRYFWQALVGYNVAAPANLVEDARAWVELELEETRLDGETGPAVGTGRYERVATDPFVTSNEGNAAMFEDASPSGWAGRGAEGLLAGTLVDANDVAAAIAEDSKDRGNRGGGLLARGDEVQLEGVPGELRWRRV